MTRLCIAGDPHEHPVGPTLAPKLVQHCRPMRGVHLDACNGENCSGCMPKLAEEPLLCCTSCRLRVEDCLAELPGLWDDLVTPTRSGGSAKRAVGAERPTLLGDEARNARDAAERLLEIWCAVLPPVAWGSSWPNAWAVPPPLAAPVLIRRAGGIPAKTIPRMASRVSGYVRWLLADPVHADQLIHDVDVVHHEAHRRAYPARPLGHTIGSCPVGTAEGPCGGQVRAVVDTLDELGWARCGACQTSADIDWWQALMPPEAHEWLGMKALRWHLTLHCHRQIGESTIRTWATPTARTPWPALPSVCDVASRRPLYRVAEARELCEMSRRRGRPRLSA